MAGAMDGRPAGDDARVSRLHRTRKSGLGALFVADGHVNFVALVSDGSGKAEAANLVGWAVHGSDLGAISLQNAEHRATVLGLRGPSVALAFLERGVFAIEGVVGKFQHGKKAGQAKGFLENDGSLAIPRGQKYHLPEVADRFPSHRGSTFGSFLPIEANLVDRRDRELAGNFAGVGLELHRPVFFGERVGVDVTSRKFGRCLRQCGQGKKDER